MKKKIFAGLMTAALVVTSLTVAPKIEIKADNPIIQNEYTADPAPFVVGDTLYLITSHDADTLVNGFYTMNDWRCYSTKDMVNWTSHGSIMNFRDFTWTDRKDPRAWAPQAVERDGKYYLFVPIRIKDGAPCITVAVADKPEGPYKDVLGKPMINNGNWDNIDPTVFIDDDGEAYLYWGNPNLYLVKLNKDMISYDKNFMSDIADNKEEMAKKGIVEIKDGIVKYDMTPESFGEPSTAEKRKCSYGEGPWFYKRDGKYYMIYASFPKGQSSESLSYSMSDSPTGPWVFKGDLLKGNTYTIHSGVCDYKGHSYLFYHTQDLPGGSLFHRSVAVEELTYNEDGTINPLEMSKTGPEPIANLNPYVWTEAENYAWGNKVEEEGDATRGINLCSLKKGSYVKVRNVDFGEDGAASFKANMASMGKGKVEVRLDSTTGTVAGTLNVESTGEANTYKVFSTTVTGMTGVHDLYLMFEPEDNKSPLKMDNWRFAKAKEEVALPDPTSKPSPAPTFEPTPTNTPKPTKKPATPTPAATPTVEPAATPAATPVPVVDVPVVSPAPETPTPVTVAKVSGLKAKVKSLKATFTWKKVADAKGYQVVYSTDKKLKKSLKKLSVKKNRAKSAKLKKGKKYFVKVRAYQFDAAGKKVYGKYSRAVSFKAK